MIEKLVQKAISFLGAKEPTGDDQFIQYYNNITGAGFSMSVAWCAIFVTVVARLAGVATSIIPNFASCDLGKKWFSDRGRYEKSKAYGGTYTPKRGDIVFYSSKRAQSDSTHVGYIVDAAAKLKVIEGNKSDAVGYRSINPGDSYIIGYGRVADFLTVSSTVTDTAKAIWDFLISKGLNAYAAAGLMGNLHAESALNPKNLQNTSNKKLNLTDEEYTQKVDDGTYTNFVRDSAGYGLAQWTYWSRKQNLHEFAKSAGKSIGDLSMQLEFLWNELQGYKTVINTLKTAKSIREASDAVITGYEKPADQSEGAKKKRAEYGQVYFDRYTKLVQTEKETTCTVEEFQEWLNENYGAGLKVDGKYGPKTEAAAVKAWQQAANDILAAGLATDGDFGPKSKAAAAKAEVKRGTRGEFVFILEGVLCAKGYYAGELDGISGSILVAGIKAFQKAKGLKANGHCDPETWFALFN